MLTGIGQFSGASVDADQGDGSQLAGRCAGFAIAVGLLVLTGWAAGIETLKRVHPDLVAMNPLTASCLILAGASIWLQLRGHVRLGQFAATLVALAVLAKFGDLATGAVPVDRLLFAGELAGSPGGQPDQMAPNSATALLLVALALLFSASRARAAQVAAQALAVGGMLVAILALVSYAFGTVPLSSVGRFIPMALHTAAALVATAVGVIALGRDTLLTRILCDRGPAGAMARLILPCAVASPFIIGTGRLWGERLGAFDPGAGAALAAVGTALVNCVLLIVSILALRRSDVARRERQEALARSERFSRKINQASPDCVSLLDADGKVLFSNEAALRAHNLDGATEMTGTRWSDWLDAAVRPAVEAAIEVAREGRVGRLTLGLKNVRDGLRWYESLISMLEEADGQPAAFIVMSRDITHQKAVEDQVRWAATHDSLTRLPNRAYFQSRLDQICAASEHSHFAVLVLDVDHFKQVNDTLGHDVGDALLSTVASRLRRSVRKHDFVARLGGDEFAVILGDVNANEAVDTIARKLARALKEPWTHNGQVMDCRVSIGACLALRPVGISSELLKNADIALYAAKLQGGGAIAVYQSGMRAELQKRASEVALAREALKHDLIVPAYQPKVDLKTGRLTGFEALLRWRHHSRGMQKPALIAAAFEDIELASAITDRMLDCLLKDMRVWLDAGIEFGHIAVNASSADFRQKHFAERLLARLELARVPPGRLQVEVTETVFLGRRAEYVEGALKTLSEAGVRIALDDFGTGYASLTHLKQFPVDVVKIDQSFLRDITDPHNAAIIRTVVSLGRSLDLDVVAEGVETADQEDYLLSEGCEFGQGFLYGKAAPAAHVPRLIKAGLRRVAMAA